MKPIRQLLLILGQVGESEKRGREEKAARAHLFASFHSAICVGPLPMYYVSLSLFLSAALVCTQLIHGRARASSSSSFLHFLFPRMTRMVV